MLGALGTAVASLIADKGYHSRSVLKELDGGAWKSHIAEPAPAKGYLRWQGDTAARAAVYANRSRLKSAIGRATMHKRGELVERSFAHVLDRAACAGLGSAGGRTSPSAI